MPKILTPAATIDYTGPIGRPEGVILTIWRAQTVSRLLRNICKARRLSAS